MIESLHVRDLAVVEDARVAFGPGLNVVTGETGAGKSVLIGAIDLLRGGRADHSLVRAGARECLVEAVLTPGPAFNAVQDALRDLGLPECEDGALLLRRTVSAESSGGRCHVNDAPATVQALRRLGALLVDLHGPHDNQSLFDPAAQLAMVDASSSAASSAGGRSAAPTLPGFEPTPPPLPSSRPASAGGRGTVSAPSQYPPGRVSRPASAGVRGTVSGPSLYPSSSVSRPASAGERGNAAPHADYPSLYAAYRALLARRAELSGGDPEARAREIDLLAYQVDEIRSAALTDADGEALVREHADVANAARLWELGQSLTQLLTDAEPSAFDLLASAQVSLGEMERLLGDDAREWHDEVRDIARRVQELSRSVENRVQAIDASPERLAALEERLALVRRLERKYGGSLEAVRAFLEKSADRLADLASLDERRAECDREIAQAEAALKPAAAALTRRRRKAADALAAAIDRELRDLGFQNAHFRIDLSPAPYSATGADAVEFVFAPNPGEPAQPLREIASSGEIARVMLAVKTVLARHDRVPVLVFDEIDANIGGETGNAVGAKMRQIGDLGHQVLCITHLVQVAVYGRRHFVVCKGVENGRTCTTIAPVEGEARVQEIARMLGGAGITSVALDHAREMLAR